MLGVVVKDTGVGIAAEHQARVFTAFDRLGHENGTIGGAGIGLAISRRLAELTGAALLRKRAGARVHLHDPGAARRVTGHIQPRRNGA
ncbi:ATP-binding protein [Gemmobacter lanyuensis]